MISPIHLKSRSPLIDILINTELYRSYSAAFEHMTLMVLLLEPPFENEDLIQVTTFTTAAGLSQTRVPVKIGRKLVAVLRIGGVCLATATSSKVSRYEASVALLRSFAFQLGECAHRLVFASTVNEPETVRLAKVFIMQHLGEPMSLDAVASNVHVSPFHFCKIFKRATSMTFTDFVNHARVEKARRMLLRPEFRITDVAYDVGFQSLSHFNRSFRRIANESPTQYRERLKTSASSLMVA
jgi:AraC-like DNA-binding protein